MNARHFEFSGVSKVFPGEKGPAVIVQNFNLKIADGEFLCLIGHSGCGKSTVLSMAAGLQPLSAGAIILAGKEITGPGPDRGVVFQSPSLFHWMSALQNVLLGVEQVFPDKSRDEREAIAREYLTLVGLEDALHKRPAELSAGMRQRVGLARAFALSPRVLLLDEPFGMLDSLSRLELQEALLELWRKDRKTALMITHDVDEALFLSDRVAMMTQGPAAKVGEILQIPFERPRDRRAILEDPRYYALRERIIDFLEAEDERRAAAEAGTSHAGGVSPTTGGATA
ncbi:MAG TPA: nitrate ABC transporter ATP-binding protein [Polyangiales bacterium]|nr:nitrate ABC transporter ATP-binding protein [Polyangiales bacterium]